MCHCEDLDRTRKDCVLSTFQEIRQSPWESLPKLRDSNEAPRPLPTGKFTQKHLSRSASHLRPLQRPCKPSKFLLETKGPGRRLRLPNVDRNDKSALPSLLSLSLLPYGFQRSPGWWNKKPVHAPRLASHGSRKLLAASILGRQVLCLCPCLLLAPGGLLRVVRGKTPYLKDAGMQDAHESRGARPSRPKEQRDGEKQVRINPTIRYAPTY